MSLRFSVIVATQGLKKRPSLRGTLRALKNQTYRNYEVITDDSPPNEYYARNRAAKRANGDVLAFCDDDTVPPENWLANAARYFENPKVQVLTGPVIGNVFGWGQELRINEPFWGIGCNLMVRRGAFFQVGGFIERWDLPRIPRGWRSDTALLWSVIKHYGYDSYVHAEDVEMHHPGPMGSVWDPEVEAQFYRRFRQYVLRYIAPYDPRISQFAVVQGLEKDPRVIRYLSHDQKPRLDWIRREIHHLDYVLHGRTKILDVGGEDGFLFAGTGWDYTVMDLDVYEVPDGRFIQHDADTKWPFDNDSFDVVVLGEILEHVERPNFVVKEATRVAKYMVLITVPNEYAWSSSKAPLLTREERMKRDGFTNVDDMARHFASKSPYLKQLYPESKKPHLWHVRWFTRTELEALIKNNVDSFDYAISEIKLPEWSWFTVKIRKKLD
ncbi:MAG: glycosyltransferase [Thaumarchaeota archaeon]|nr:glycosyltransferase [Candidatus Calditenuaceae archaeon]